MSTRADITEKLRTLMSDYMYTTDVDDAFEMIDKLLRASYIDDYNSAAKQFGAHREFFRDDITDDLK